MDLPNSRCEKRSIDFLLYFRAYKFEKDFQIRNIIIMPLWNSIDQQIPRFDTNPSLRLSCSMLELTDAAAAEISQLVLRQGKMGEGLRIYIEKGGCSGLSYEMKLDLPQTSDHTVSRSGATLMIDPESLLLLKGSTIDFEDGLTNRGFRILNPNAKQTCGCGTSFEA
jgi:iron-sulfur cluster assembly accessory protein